MDFIYEISELTKVYPGRPILSFKDLRIPRGSITAISGPNGCGKSTLLRLMALVEAPTSGRIIFNPSDDGSVRDHLRRQVTLLLQEPYLLKRSVFQNVAYGLLVRGQRHGLEAKVNMALHLVGLDPGEFARRAWYELSGGEAQRVALAARLILRPQALLLDEPTSNLDVQSSELIKDATLRARDMGATILVASHDHDWLEAIGDQEIVFPHRSPLNGRAEPKSTQPS